MPDRGVETAERECAEHLIIRNLMHWSLYNRNRNERRQRVLRKLANARAAKARKRAENPPEHEPRFLRYFPLELGVRDKSSAETAWTDLRSVRDAARRLSIILKHYTP